MEYKCDYNGIEYIECKSKPTKRLVGILIKKIDLKNGSKYYYIAYNDDNDLLDTYKYYPKYINTELVREPNWGIGDKVILQPSGKVDKL